MPGVLGSLTRQTAHSFLIRHMGSNILIRPPSINSLNTIFWSNDDRRYLVAIASPAEISVDNIVMNINLHRRTRCND